MEEGGKLCDPNFFLRYAMSCKAEVSVVALAVVQLAPPSLNEVSFPSRRKSIEVWGLDPFPLNRFAPKGLRGGCGSRLLRIAKGKICCENWNRCPDPLTLRRGQITSVLAPGDLFPGWVWGHH